MLQLSMHSYSWSLWSWLPCKRILLFVSNLQQAAHLLQHNPATDLLIGPGYCPQRTAALHTELSEGQAQARLRLTRGAATAPTPTLYARFPSITSGPPRGAEPSGPRRVRCTAPAASTTAARCGPALRQAGPRKWAAPAAPGGPEGSGAPPGGRSRHPAAAGMVLVAARGARVTRRKAERNRHGDAAAARMHQTLPSEAFGFERW